MSVPEENKLYDIAIIGGGIAGAGIARDAALRGMSVLLLEKDLFGSGTSSKSSKLIHGGLRYLETAWSAFTRGDAREARKNFYFVFASLKETRILRRIAPDLVEPIDLVVPVYRGGARSRWVVFAGCFLYALLAFAAGTGRWPTFLFSKKTVLKKIPPLNSKNLVGGVIIGDCRTNDRSLVRATIESARRAGTVALEHARVTGYTVDAMEKTVRVSFEENGLPKNALCRKLVNASGPWLDKVRSENGESGEKILLPIAGSHLEFKCFLPHSVILQAEDNRVFFVINVGDVSRVGTTERPCEDPDRVRATPEETSYLLKELAHYFPGLKFTETDILSRDAGIRPLAKPRRNLSPNAVSREHEVRVGPTGVVHVLGVKLTDHRRAAEKITDALAEEISREKPGILRRSITAKKNLRD